jgi:hypothetical protein
MIQGRVGCDLGDLLEWLSGIEVIKTIVWQGRNINNGFDQELSGDLPQLVSGTGKWFECSFQGQELLTVHTLNVCTTARCIADVASEARIVATEGGLQVTARKPLGRTFRKLC